MKSLKSINYRMYAALLLLGFMPTIYTTLRVYFIGNMPGEWSYSIAGQLSWVSLIFEVVSEAIILPLYYFIGDVIRDRVEFTNRIKTGMLVTTIVYTFFAIVVIIFIKPMLGFMAAETEIIEESAVYIRIESVAYIFSMMLNFVLVALITVNKDKYIYTFAFFKLILSLFCDVFLVSSLDCSLRLGVNGIGISNILVNLILVFVILIILKFRENVDIFYKTKMDFRWMKGFLKQGSISGLESFVRNAFYIIMVCKMVNVVGEQGTYWVANNFIWGWLLLPVIQLGELIKRDCGSEKDAVLKKTPGYFELTAIICFIWFMLIPLYKPFMRYVLNYSDVDKLFKLVIILIGFYVTYAFQNIFDCTFYGLGKVHYMLWEAVVTNCTYYVAWFIAYKSGIWIPNLTGIAIMFGAGCAFDAVVSGIAYVIMRKRYK